MKQLHALCIEAASIKLAVGSVNYHYQYLRRKLHAYQENARTLPPERISGFMPQTCKFHARSTFMCFALVLCTGRFLPFIPVHEAGFLTAFRWIRPWCHNQPQHMR